jgi:hypothetical protein
MFKWIFILSKVDPNNALEKLKRIKIYKYDFKQEFVDINGGLKSDMGIIILTI